MKNGLTMRRVTLTIGLLISFAFLLPGCGEAQDTGENAAVNARPDAPYKATTVDECVQEKECVWYEFKRLITKSHLEDVDKWRLARWGKPVQIKIMGDDQGKHTQEITSSIEILDRYFPGRIRISDENVNFFIVFRDSIKEGFYDSDYNFWKRIFKDKMVFVEQAFDMSFEGDSRCVQLSTYNARLEYDGVILYVERDSPDIDSCIRRGLKGGLTSPYPYYHQPLFAKHNPEQFENHRINKLDLLLQALLYDPLFQTGMTLSQIEDNFSQAYAETFNTFNSQLEKEALPLQHWHWREDKSLATFL